MNPTINIQYNRFLDPIFISYIQAQEKWKDWLPPSEDVRRKQILLYKNLWNESGNQIIDGIKKATGGLQFNRNWIDVFIVSGNPRPFSRPVVLKCTYTESQFIATITHELVHCLLSDNESFVYPHGNTMVGRHVVVHAVMKYILIDVLKKTDILKEEITASKGEYREAWDIVESQDYHDILKSL